MNHENNCKKKPEKTSVVHCIIFHSLIHDSARKRASQHCKFFSNSVPVNKSHSQTVNFWKKFFFFCFFDTRVKIMMKNFFVHRSVNRNSQVKSHIHSLWTLWTKKSENAYFDPKSKNSWKKNFCSQNCSQSSQICSQRLNLKTIYSEYHTDIQKTRIIWSRRMRSYI